jgi:hypothetical protein
MANDIEAKAAMIVAKRGRSKQKVTEMVDGKEVKGVIKGGFTPRKAWEMQKTRSEDGTVTKKYREAGPMGTVEITKERGPKGKKYTGRSIPNPSSGEKTGATRIEKKKGQKTEVKKYGSDR